MADPFFDKFIADLVKGAEANSRANGGPGVHILIDRENRGREEKLANHAGLGSLAGGLMLPGVGAPIGAALGADPGQGLSAAGGSILGGAGGMAAGGLAGGGIGALLGALAHNPELGMGIGAGIGGLGGGVGGMMYGAQRGGHKDTIGEKIHHKLSALETRYTDGVKAAAATFGIKEAFLGPMIGALAGPALARAGIGAATKGALGAGAANIAGKVAPRIAGGLGGGAFDMAASTAGQAVGQKMQPQQPQPPGM